VVEIAAAIEASTPKWMYVPVIPIRMTEAWLVLDENAIRWVAGRPSGTEPLNLPTANTVEAHPDPKSLLREALRTASGFRGRRLRKFDRDFGAHRRQLLERLDRDGPLRELSAWQALERAVEDMSKALLDPDAKSGSG
jgi:hypothetical protein